MRHIADRFTVVLDANVLYPFLVRDVLLTMAEAGMFRARWSAEIMDEWQRNLIADKPEKEAKINRTAFVMTEAFPEALVDGFDALIDKIDLPDPKDRHVVAAAIQADAQHIITNNIKDFPPGVLDRYGIEAKTPDDFIVSTFELYPTDAVAALRAMRQRYNDPEMSKADLMLALIKAGLPKTAAALKPHIESL
jgi:predicted nucleic acid-binding protein